MYIGRYKENAPWLSDEEIRERMEHDILKGRLVIATPEEILKVDTGDWLRVGTWVICETCGKAYVEHPVLDYDPSLHRLCDGILGKT